MNRTRLTVLRSAEFVVSKACAFCLHASFHQNDMVSCSILKEDVSSYGSCQYFGPDDKKAEDVLDFDKGFLDRRTFTRNNRHKAKTRY